MSFQIDIADDETWKKELTGSPGTVQVVEVYQGWCGPCKAIVANFKRLYFDLGDRPLKFYTANCQKVEALKQYQGHCMPVFLFYKDNKLQQKVEGVQAPVLARHVEQLSAEAAKAIPVA
ncbi:hypothetical protein WJX72_006603 [[Myrmecia] bisecta]|uniref:Thioredoxin domain-containing protein n=1 Tax=[Myrmecia] bisecta TaxID=41462 RepID=A0AAW1PEL5_9CHLO